jgi:hypothetical protein
MTVEIVQDPLNYAPREEIVPYPFPPGNSYWFWTPHYMVDAIPVEDGPNHEHVIQTMTDFTLSCHKALRKVWEGYFFVFGMCCVHAWVLWHRKNRGFFNDYKNNEKRMSVDFELYKKICSKHLVPLARRLMMQQWMSYGENTVVQKWFRQWSPTLHTRVELNNRGLLRGALPAHNNNSEGTNNADKISFDHRKHFTAVFVSNFGALLRFRSHRDLIFCRKLHRSVHNIEFYKYVKTCTCA